MSTPEPEGVWSIESVRALGITTDIETAASILGIGRTKAYALAKSQEFPVDVLRVGRRYASSPYRQQPRAHPASLPRMLRHATRPAMSAFQNPRMKAPAGRPPCMTRLIRATGRVGLRVAAPQSAL
jgi:hypothetical protein